MGTGKKAFAVVGGLGSVLVLASQVGPDEAGSKLKGWASFFHLTWPTGAIVAPVAVGLIVYLVWIRKDLPRLYRKARGLPPLDGGGGLPVAGLQPTRPTSTAVELGHGAIGQVEGNEFVGYDRGVSAGDGSQIIAKANKMRRGPSEDLHPDVEAPRAGDKAKELEVAFSYDWMAHGWVPDPEEEGSRFYRLRFYGVRIINRSDRRMALTVGCVLGKFSGIHNFVNVDLEGTHRAEFEELVCEARTWSSTRPGELDDNDIRIAIEDLVTDRNILRIASEFQRHKVIVFIPDDPKTPSAPDSKAPPAGGGAEGATDA